MSCRRTFAAVWTLSGCLSYGTVNADPPTTRPAAALPPDVAEAAERAIDRALEYLRARQDKDGGWTAQYGPAVTAIVARGFVDDDNYGPKHPVVQRAVRHIMKFEQPDGGIYDRTMNLANYQTSVVLMLLPSLDDPALKPKIARTQAFLSKLQYDAAESVDADNPWYGGAGYNERKRPDLSNTQMMLEALHASGLPKDDPVYQRALKFVSRCQMLGTTNDLPFVARATDGGFIYSPVDKGESKADEYAPEGPPTLRSYGSMTYAGFKSMLYAGVERDDPRVRAAVEWIRRHYTLESNANMPGKGARQGLYYYYHVFARALHAWGEPVILDAADHPHNWRIDLCRKLVSLQNPDGSWINEADRWLEGDPNYVTGLTVTTLQTALAK